MLSNVSPNSTQSLIHPIVAKRIATIQQAFATIDDNAFIDGDFKQSTQSRLGYHANNILAYVWAADNGLGTLEDWLQPMFAQNHSEKITQGATFVDNAFG